MEAVKVFKTFWRLRVSFLPPAPSQLLFRNHRLSISIPPPHGPSHLGCTSRSVVHASPCTKRSGWDHRCGHYARQKTTKLNHRSLPSRVGRRASLTLKEREREREKKSSIPYNHCILPYRRSLSSSRSKGVLAGKPALRAAGAHAWIGPGAEEKSIAIYLRGAPCLFPQTHAPRASCVEPPGPVAGVRCEM